MEIPNALVAAARSIEAADLRLGQSVARRREAPVAKGADQVGKLGDQGPLYVVGVALVAGGLLFWNLRLARTGAAMLAAVAAADAGKTIVKRHITRTRPHVLLEEGRYRIALGGSPKKPEQSFPSGHIAGCVAAARAVARSYPKSGPSLGAAVALMAAARVVKGAHWPLDVLAGAVIGWVAEAVTGGLLRRLGWR